MSFSILPMCSKDSKLSRDPNCFGVPTSASHAGASGNCARFGQRGDPPPSPDRLSTEDAWGGPERSSPGSVVSSHRSGRNQNYSPRSNATSISRHIQQQSPGFGGRQSGRPQPMTARSSHSRITEDDDMASVAGSTVSVAASVISRSAHQKRRFAN